MGYDRYIQCILLVFCFFPLSLGECGPMEQRMPSVVTEVKGEKNMDVRYLFDFPDLSRELIRQNYVNLNYNIHKNRMFHFSVLMNKEWNAVKVAEPAQLPMDGSIAEIGLFNLYAPTHDPKGDIKAQLVIYMAGVPAERTAADCLDEQMSLMLKGLEFKIIQTKMKDTNLGPTKDILISYSSNNTSFLSRMCAFKIKDDTKAYVFGEKHLLYLLLLNTQEKDYNSFGAEPFYVSKVSFQPLPITTDHSQADEISQRKALEGAYKKYIAACNSGSANALKETMSSFQYGTITNNLASAKRELTPELIKSIAEDAADIFKMKFVSLFQNGPTAGLLYVQDSQERDASNKPRVTFTFIKFVNENALWKVDGMMDAGYPKYQKDGTETQFNMDDLPPSLAIDGKVLKAPEPIPVSYGSGFLDVFCYGYKTTVTINGIEQVVDGVGSSSMIIKGGLRKGQNDVKITFSKFGEQSSSGPSVTIRRIINERETIEVFKYEPKQSVEGEHALSFTIAN